MTNIYMGELTLVSLIAALGRRFFSNKEIRFFAAAALFFALYALGRYTPAFAFFYHLPGVDLWRRPADATFLLGATLAILAGYGFNLIERGDATPRTAWLIGAVAALFAARAACRGRRRTILRKPPGRSRQARSLPRSPSRLSSRLATGCCAAPICSRRSPR